MKTMVARFDEQFYFSTPLNLGCAAVYCRIYIGADLAICQFLHWIILCEFEIHLF